jgi:hypothetical protein
VFTTAFPPWALIHTVIVLKFVPAGMARVFGYNQFNRSVLFTSYLPRNFSLSEWCFTLTALAANIGENFYCAPLNFERHRLEA